MRTTFGMILYIGDDIVDLYPNALIFYTVQRQNIGNLTARSVSASNNFTAPWTENNERLFGFAKEENSNTSLTYSLRSCRMVEGGVESQGNVLYITESEDRQFSLQIFENIFDWFEGVNNKSIADMNPVPPSAWLASDIDAARLNTDGIVSALVFWGNLVYSADFFLPSFYYHTLIKSILEFTGLTIEGNILTDTRFTNLIVPYPGEKFEYPESYYRQFNFFNEESSDVPVTNSINAEFSVLGQSVTEYLHGTYFFRVSVGGISYGTGTALELRLRKNGVLVASKSLAISPAPGASAELSFTDFIEPGDSINIYIYSNAMSGPGIDYTVVGAPGSTYMLFTPDGVIHRGLVNWNSLWPEISCTDLLKDFFNRFAIIPNQVDNRLILKTLEEIIADVPGALDWSGKLVNPKKKPISFKTAYAQENLFSYNNLVSDADLGSGSIDIANNTLPLKKTLFKSIFGNSNTVQKFSFNAALIPAFDVNNPPTNEDFEDGRLIVVADSIVQSDEGKVVFLFGSSPFNVTIDVLTSGTTVMLKNTGPSTITLIEGAGIELPGGSFGIDPDKYVIIVFNLTAYPEVYLFDTITTTMEIVQAPGLRLLTLKDRTIENAITFDVASRTDYKIGYFIDETLAKDTGFEYFIAQFYPSLEAALQKTKTPTKFAKLGFKLFFCYQLVDVLFFE